MQARVWHGVSWAYIEISIPVIWHWVELLVTVPETKGST
jgi:hypothetical protein